jgi:hypothetical protein
VYVDVPIICRLSSLFQHCIAKVIGALYFLVHVAMNTIICKSYMLDGFQIVMCNASMFRTRFSNRWQAWSICIPFQIDKTSYHQHDHKILFHSSDSLCRSQSFQLIGPTLPYALY